MKIVHVNDEFLDWLQVQRNVASEGSYHAKGVLLGYADNGEVFVGDWAHVDFQKQIRKFLVGGVQVVGVYLCATEQQDLNQSVLKFVRESGIHENDGPLVALMCSGSESSLKARVVENGTLSLCTMKLVRNFSHVVTKVNASIDINLALACKANLTVQDQYQAIRERLETICAELTLEDMILLEKGTKKIISCDLPIAETKENLLEVDVYFRNSSPFRKNNDVNRPHFAFSGSFKCIGFVVKNLNANKTPLGKDIAQVIRADLIQTMLTRISILEQRMRASQEDRLHPTIALMENGGKLGLPARVEFPLRVFVGTTYIHPQASHQTLDDVKQDMEKIFTSTTLTFSVLETQSSFPVRTEKRVKRSYHFYVLASIGIILGLAISLLWR